MKEVLFCSDKPLSVVMSIDAPTAQKILLASNYDNRKVRKSVVAKYARDMLNGNWLFTPEPIVISKTGRLLNGQHRLMAVVESHCPQKFMVTSGFDDETFSVLDRGALRTKSDALKMDNRLISCANLLAKIAAPGYMNQPTDADSKRAADCIQSSFNELMSYASHTAKIFSSVPFRLAAVARIMEGKNKDHALEMYKMLVFSHVKDLPPIGHALIKAVLTGRMKNTGYAGQISHLSVAWDVFDPASMNKTKIYIEPKPGFVSHILKATGYKHMGTDQ